MEKKGTSIFAKNLLVSLLIIISSIVLILTGYALGKYNSDKRNVSNETTKEAEIIKDEKLVDTEGVLNTEKVSDSIEINMNNKKYTLAYNLVEDGVVGTHIIKFNSKEIFKKGAADGIGDIKYQIFTASDGKQYLLVSYYQWGMYGIIVNDNGEILSKINEWSDEISCFMSSKTNSDLITVKDGNVYYYKYKDDSLKENGNYLEIKMEESEITINNNKIFEKLTGNEIAGSASQCS